MSTEADKKKVGLFVVGALTLAILAIGCFGSGSLFQESTTYVLYFEGSVQGLNIGAPVVLRGVPIGRVTNIKLVSSDRGMVISIPVYIEIDDNKLVSQARARFTDWSDQREDLIRTLVDHGLRAQLGMQSLITGQLIVELDFFPATPVVLHGGQGDTPELPTTPSPLEDLSRVVRELPLTEAVNEMRAVLTNMNSLLGSPEFKSSVGNLSTALRTATDSFHRMDAMMADARKTAQGYNTLAVQLNKDMPRLVASLDDSLKRFDTTMSNADKTLASMRATSSGDSPAVLEFTLAMKELNGAARAIRTLANMLDRHPEVLLRGKQGQAD